MKKLFTEWGFEYNKEAKQWHMPVSDDITMIADFYLMNRDPSTRMADVQIQLHSKTFERIRGPLRMKLPDNGFLAGVAGWDLFEAYDGQRPPYPDDEATAEALLARIRDVVSKVIEERKQITTPEMLIAHIHQRGPGPNGKFFLEYIEGRMNGTISVEEFPDAMSYAEPKQRALEDERHPNAKRITTKSGYSYLEITLDDLKGPKNEDR